MDCVPMKPVIPCESVSGVVAVKGRRIIACIEDDRLTRSKVELYKSKARFWAVKQAEKLGFSESEIEVLCCNGLTTEEQLRLSKETGLYGVQFGHYVAKRYRDHHLKHAISAYYQSGFEDATILVLDGCDYPQGTSIALFKAEGKDITPIKSWDTKHSLGIFYAHGCTMCGFQWFHPGKLMGASSFTATEFIDVPYKEYFRIDDDGNIKDALIDYILPEKYDIDGSPNPQIRYRDDDFLHLLSPSGDYWLRPLSFEFKYAYRAYIFQRLFDGAVISLLRYAKKKTSSKNLVLTGGCAGNVVTNGEILHRKLYDNVFVPPMHNDAGNAIGAAILYHDVEITKPFVYNKVTYPVPKEYNIEISPQKLADYIRDGYIVAWFEGGSEYGQRALCHRSLLANALIPSMAYRLNEIKNREYWRPFAPVVLDKFFHLFFNVDRISELHKYMLSTEYMRSRFRFQFKNILAPDGTARPQVLIQGNPYTDTLYHLMDNNLLPILINTSMNSKGEAICETPEDAMNFVKHKSGVLLVFVQNGRIYCNRKL